jgi:hypothetical protein
MSVPLSSAVLVVSHGGEASQWECVQTKVRATAMRKRSRDQPPDFIDRIKLCSSIQESDGTLFVTSEAGTVKRCVAILSWITNGRGQEGREVGKVSREGGGGRGEGTWRHCRQSSDYNLLASNISMSLSPESRPVAFHSASVERDCEIRI